VLSSAAGVDENPGSSRTRFRDRPETVRLHRSRSRSPGFPARLWNLARLAFSAWRTTWTCGGFQNGIVRSGMIDRVEFAALPATLGLWRCSPDGPVSSSSALTNGFPPWSARRLLENYPNWNAGHEVCREGASLTSPGLAQDFSRWPFAVQRGFKPLLAPTGSGKKKERSLRFNCTAGRGGHVHSSHFKPDYSPKLGKPIQRQRKDVLEFTRRHAHRNGRR
jgi:hypothetical protein